MKYNKKLICIIAVVSALLILCSCGYNPKTVGTIDDFDITAGNYLSLQLEAYCNAALDYSNGTSYSLGFLKDEYKGVPAVDYVNDKTVELCKRYVFIEKEFERLGLTLSDEDQNSISSSVSQSWSSVSSIYESNGVGKDTYTAAQTNYKKYVNLLSALYGEGGEKAFTQDEIRAYYEAHFTRIDCIEFPVSDVNGTALPAQTIATFADIANTMLADAKANNSLEKAFVDNFNDVYALTGEDKTADAATYAATVATDALITDMSTSYDAEFSATALGLKPGEYGVYSSDKVVYVFKAVGVAHDEDISSYVAAIVPSMASEPFDEYVAASTASYSVNLDQKARAYYSLDKIVTPQ